jgi:hypothetical protein
LTAAEKVSFGIAPVAISPAAFDTYRAEFHDVTSLTHEPTFLAA